MNQKIKPIESPLSAFNNILLDISDKLEMIYLGQKIGIDQNKNNTYDQRNLPKQINRNISFINQLLFETKSITICNCIKLVCEHNKLGVKFIGIFEDMDLIKITINNQKAIFEIFQYYLFLSSSIINKNTDHEISIMFVNSIYNQILDKTIDKNQLFMIPYKTKIKKLYDPDKTLDAIYNRFTYVIKFEIVSNSVLKYTILRCVSSELNESKSLDNIRFEDIESIKTGHIQMQNIQDFLVELFYYGEIQHSHEFSKNIA